jgi:hypothetical protein
MPSPSRDRLAAISAARDIPLLDVELSTDRFPLTLPQCCDFLAALPKHRLCAAVGTPRKRPFVSFVNTASDAGLEAVWFRYRKWRRHNARVLC